MNIASSIKCMTFIYRVFILTILKENKYKFNYITSGLKGINLHRMLNIFYLLVAGICLSNDVDTLLYHMNNARYLRELDFARVDFYERSGLYRAIKAKGGAVVQGACTVRYRRFIRPFSVFKIHSKVSSTIL